MKFVIDDLGVGRILKQGIPERFPHVHDRQTNSTRTFRSHLYEESAHVFFGSPVTAHPDWAFLVQVGHYDSITVPFFDRDFVNADGAQSFGRRMLLHQLFHVVHFQSPYLAPGKLVHFRHSRHGHFPTLAPNGACKTLSAPSGEG